MNLEGRRESNNVEDRRMSGGTMAGLGIGGALIVGLITLLLGGDLGDVISNVQNQGGITTSQTSAQREFTQEEQELATFSRKILAGTEDVWTAVLQRYGIQYVPPKMVLYSGVTSSGCGSANSSVGPFYCSADQTIYLDLDFFKSMRTQIGADGDFAYAYVIAHEIGHHVQYLLGTLSQAHQQMARTSKVNANRISVRIELQADFYAGVWAYNDNRMYGSLEDGDLMEALTCATKIGDDYLQKKSQGYVVEDSFTHGTAQQRLRWLKKGLTTGDLRQGDTFSCSESEL
ncbi:MAG: zinc metallopeptidase [Bacteroidales bacterium]|nr:zinc metallopeptidase [Bacteroidales bacterium]